MNCPTCGQVVQTDVQPRLTPRELDVLSAWWHTGTVRRAALLAGVGQQRAKNLLAQARIRNRVHTNGALAVLHLEALRSMDDLVASHNKDRTEAA